MKVLRVLQLGPYPPPHGGVQANVVALRTFLRKQGHQCGVINITRHRQDDHDELYFPDSSVKLLALLARLPYRVIHLHVGGIYPLRVMLLSLACCWLPGHRCVLTFHSGGFPGSPPGQRASPASFLGFVLRQFDHVIAVNSELADVLVRFGVSRSRLSIIRPDSFDPVEISTSLPETIEAFFSSHDKVLVAVGLLEPEYDLSMQLDAMADIRKSLPEAGLLIIGSGSQEDELRLRIASHPERDHIHLAGDVPHSDTLLAIRSAAALLRTTRYDGDSVSVREALRLGTPVIASNNGMRPESVHLLSRHDALSLAETVHRVVGGLEPHRADSIPDAFDQSLREIVSIYTRLDAAVS